MPSIEKLKEALEGVEGATPQEVLDAFLPKNKKIGNRSLVPLTLGHSLFLANCGHPLSKGDLENWRPDQTALALYTFTSESKELAEQVKDGTIEDKLIEFTETLSLGEIPKFTALLMAHYLQSLQTGVEMHNPKERAAQKKTRSVGFWQRLVAFVASILGRRNL